MTTFPPPTLHASHYRNDPEQWALERDGIFARSWQFLAHESQVAAPGEAVAETLAGFPVIVFRDDAGVLAGFHNVCRHRAGPLALVKEAGAPPRLVCRYHGWSYAQDGRLRAARDFGPTLGFDPQDYGLWPIRVAAWRGLIFATLDLKAPALEQLTQPLDRRLQGRAWGGFDVALRRVHDLRCNWKTYVENYLEGYHVSAVHPGLAQDIDASRYAVSVQGLTAIHEAPQSGDAGVYEGLWAWMWPNTGINLYGRGVMIERISPVGAGACRLDYLYLMPKGEVVPPETLRLSDEVSAEDVEIVEAVQRNLDAGLYGEGRLSMRHEAALAQFQRLVGSALAKPSVAAAPLGEWLRGR